MHFFSLQSSEAAVAPVTGSAPVSSFGRTAEVKAWGKEKVVEWLAENELHGWVLLNRIKQI